MYILLIYINIYKKRIILILLSFIFSLRLLREESHGCYSVTCNIHTIYNLSMSQFLNLSKRTHAIYSLFYCED